MVFVLCFLFFPPSCFILKLINILIIFLSDVRTSEYVYFIPIISLIIYFHVFWFYLFLNPVRLPTVISCLDGAGVYHFDSTFFW